MRRIGIILLDWSEVILFVYEYNHGWKEIYTERKELLDPDAGRRVCAPEFAKNIASFTLQGYRMKVKEWKFCARYIMPEILIDIAESTGLRIEKLNLNEEQKLLSRGLLL